MDMRVNDSFPGVIGAIFDKLAVRYGAEWLRQWDGVDMILVKSDWGSELSGFASNLEPLRYALRNLPERCPNVRQFRDIANNCPLPEFQCLPSPVANPEKVAEQIAKQTGLKQAMAKSRANDREWAPRIMARVANGEKISPTVVAMARSAAGVAA